MMKIASKKKTFKTDRVADLYRAITVQSRQQTFFQDYQIPDTPQGRFEILALHLALMLRRLKFLHAGEWEQSQSLSQNLCDWAVADMEESLRLMPVSELKVSRYLKTFVEGFYGRLVAYDKALELDDKSMLERAIRTNIYGIVGEVDSYIVEGLASYAYQTWDWLQETGIFQIIDDLTGE